MKLKDKIVIVTGSSSGIGKATALLFAQEGATVVVNSKSSGAQGMQVVEEIKKNGGNGIYVSGDVSVTSDVDALPSAVTGEVLVVDGGFQLK